VTPDSNPLQMTDQSDPTENPEPPLVEWKQPYSTKGEAPTSTPKNPPQPTGDQRTDPDAWMEEHQPATNSDTTKDDKKDKDS
jgi:hypothetical protein